MSNPPLFDQKARLRRRDRAAAAGIPPFLAQRALEDVIDRLGAVQRRFSHALLVGTLDPAWGEQLEAFAERVTLLDPAPGAAKRSGGMTATESALPFDADSFDLLVSAGTWDTADDLPRALLEAGRVLRADSLLIGVLPGAGSLPRLRAAMAAADEASGRAAPRLHPGIDARTMGDLLQRAGFVLTVVDIDRVSVGYGDLLALVQDLRAHGATNVLARRSPVPLSRGALQVARHAFLEDAPQGRTYERIELIHFLGWTPGPGQPQPAKRGSATASLANALQGPPHRSHNG